MGRNHTKKIENPPNAVLDNTPQNLARRGKPLSSILKNTKRVSVNDKNDSSMDSEDVPELDETELWTPSDFLERSGRIVKRTRVQRSSVIWYSEDPER